MADASIRLLLLGEDRSAGKALRGAGRDAESTGEKFKRLGKIAAVGLAGGLVTAGSAMVKFGQQASDLSETQSKVAQIFGKESTAALEKFADTAGTSLGQSKQQALDAAATFGIIGKSAGKSGTDLVKFSTQMTSLAGDLASFNNTSPEEAIEAIGSAMRGEAEPIRKYGVLLDDATLRNEALQLGLIKTTKDALTPQQKALAAQAAILKQTKDAQGDFARTSDGLANKQRILKAEFTNLTTQLGQKALPVMLDVTNAALDLVEGFEDGTGAGGEIRDVLEDVAAAGKTVAGAIDSIPGPVKKYGVAMLAAVVVTSKLRALTGPLGTGLSTMVTNFRSAETRTAGLTKGLRGLGSGLTNVAGAGGMLLLANGADEAGTSMGALKSAAGGALSGAALGAFAGPVGAAIGAGVGGLAGGLLSLAGAGRKAEASAIPLASAFTNLATSLTGVNAALSENSRAAVFADLGQNGLLKTTRELGIADRTAVNAALGKRDALAALSRQISRETVEQRAARLETMRNTVSVERYKEMIRQAKAEVAAGTLITNDQRASLIKVRGSLRATRLETLKNNVAIAGSAEELKKAQAALRAFMKEPADKQIKIGVTLAAQARAFGQRLFGSGMASGGTVAGMRSPYGDRVMTMLAPGEEVISNDRGQADQWRPLLKAINSGGMADGGTVGRVAPVMSSVPSTTSQQPIVVQLVLDGKVIHESLLKQKRTNGGVSLGLG